MFIYWDSLGSLYCELTRTMRGRAEDGSGRTTDAMVADPAKVAIKTDRDAILLGPGVNEISDEEFELARPNMQLQLKAKKLRVLRPAASALPAGEDGKLAEARDITDLTEADAIKIIANIGIPTKDKDGRDQYLAQIGNRTALLRFLARDEREEVRAAIRERLETLHLEPPEDVEIERARALLGMDAA